MWRKNTVRARIGPLQWWLDCLNHPVTVSQPTSSNTPSDRERRPWRVPVKRLPAIGRILAGLAIVASSGGCILTSDLPDPALDVPPAYKFAGSAPERATPSLDWWRGFRSRELTQLMEEARKSVV